MVSFYSKAEEMNLPCAGLTGFQLLLFNDWTPHRRCNPSHPGARSDFHLWNGLQCGEGFRGIAWRVRLQTGCFWTATGRCVSDVPAQPLQLGK